MTVRIKVSELEPSNIVHTGDFSTGVLGVWGVVSNVEKNGRERIITMAVGSEGWTRIFRADGQKLVYVS